MDLKKKMGLGTVQFGMDYGISNKAGKTAEKEVEAILRYAEKQGIDTLDTASAYGNAEMVLGNNDLQAFNIISKFLPVADQPISKQLDRTLNNLKIRKLYGYIAHRPLDLLNNPFVWEQLSELKENGEISKIGFSFNIVEEADQVLQKGLIPDLIQVPYNYLDHRFEGLILALKEFGCEVHTRSAFLQGLMLMNPADLHDFFKPVAPILEELQDYGHLLPSALLKYCLTKRFIDKVIIGINSLSQLKEGISGLDESASLCEFPTRTIPHQILIPSQWPPIR